ncbi:MAG: aldehyde dehydrogenase [Proteobacteria bacterium]|nr:aldehyde dehydrogenase [Pseudomonadota bacterium]
MSAVLAGNPLIPEADGFVGHTAADVVDQAVAEVKAHLQTWKDTSLQARITLLQQIVVETAAAADGWVEAGIDARKLQRGTTVQNEDYLLGPWPTIRCARLMAATMDEFAKNGSLDTGPVRTLPNGQVAATVFPGDLFDKLLFMGHSVEIWMEPGVTQPELAATMAPTLKDPPAPKVALVLGAGNVSAISATDVLHKLFVDNEVVVLKMNPVNDYAGPFIEAAFKGLVDLGVLRVVYGGVQAGVQLTSHEDVQSIHMTGSDKTHDAIVFGPGEAGHANKQERAIQNHREMTCELGNVSPVIVVPGPWSASDFAQQGEAIASQITANVGFNCITARVVINHRSWDGRSQLLDGVRKSLSAALPRHAYYPGARDRYDSFVAAHPEAERFGSDADGKVPYTFITGVDSNDSDDIVFNTEAFAPVMAETTLDAADPVAFLKAAVEFSNNQVWGTLAASILVHPKSLKDPAMAAAVEQAIADLRYGTVAVNTWAGLSFLLMQGTWGAFPGHDAFDIQSGTGWVHNTRMFGKPQKSVIRAPFRPMVKPAWFPSHKKADVLSRRITEFEAKPGWLALMPLTVAAMLG